MFAFFRRISLKKFAKDLIYKIAENEVVNGAATIAFFLTMAVFPAAISLLSLLAYLPIKHLREVVFHFIGQAVPTDTSQVFTGIVEKTIFQRNERLLSPASFSPFGRPRAACMQSSSN